MRLTILPMGCLSSRSTVAPTDETNGQKTDATKENSSKGRGITDADSKNYTGANGATSPARFGKSIENAANVDRDRLSMSSSIEGANDDDIMSILLKNKSRSPGDGANDAEPTKQVSPSERGDASQGNEEGGAGAGDNGGNEGRGSEENSPRHSLMDQRDGDRTPSSENQNSKAIEAPFDSDANMDLLREYVAIDYEITLLEDKDALLVYHERIEQLEQLEKELDMITAEADEVASSSDIGSISRPTVGQSSNRLQTDTENDSITSAGAQSRRSRATRRQQQQESNLGNDQQLVVSKKNGSVASGRIVNRELMSNGALEDVFNKKVILEKERDKLKKEVQMVIVECDALQHKYKKRDDILDKLFDGRTGNGLENHLEQQLHWLLEQKHYVDQVFYAWKRAETLTSQTCEQLANALELLKRLPKIEELEQRKELVKSIESLLTKSLEDMEQAQKYNPNVDAPFFTDNETKRFDKIIETISDPELSQSDYSQILTVIQFVYKRAVSTRMWLEQILQTTIARDSFELAEEYKWISIQLRKERINLIKARLQSPQFRTMVQQVHEQVARQQAMAERRKQHEINRDSGIESETNEIDIEEEIYRLLELNRFRVKPDNQERRPIAITDGTTRGVANGFGLNQNGDRQLDVDRSANHMSSASSSDSNQQRQHKDQQMRDRVQKRVKGEQPLHMSGVGTPVMPSSGALRDIDSSSNMSASGPTKLKVELDEEAKRNLLKQVDQIHIRHRSRIDKIRGLNRIKANSGTVNRIQADTPQRYGASAS